MQKKVFFHLADAPHVDPRALLHTLPNEVAPLHLETQSADRWDPITFIALDLEPAALSPFRRSSLDRCYYLGIGRASGPMYALSLPDK